MTVRRLNYTGRQRISSDRVSVMLRTTDEGVLEYELELSLSDLSLPQNGRVVLEAIHQHAFQRFDHGSIAEPRVPPTKVLERFLPGEDVRFWVKVIEPEEKEGEPGRILAESVGLAPEGDDADEGSRVSILRVKPADLGEVPWRLDLSTGPVLQVNRRVGEWRAFVRSPAFAWLVYPAVLREILTQLVIVQDYREDEHDLSWRSQWIRFGAKLSGEPVPPATSGEEPALDWVEDTVDAFCRRLGLWRDYGRHLVQEMET